MKKKKSEFDSDVENALKAATLELLATRNIESITIKDISAKAGANSALIYYYFNSKNGLYKAAIASIIEDLLENYRKVSNKYSDVKDLINAWFDLNESSSDRVKMLLKIMVNFKGSPNFKRGDEEHDEIYSLIDLFYHNEEELVLRDSIARGVREGIFRAVDPERVARFISMQLDGILISSYTRGNTNIKYEIESTKNFLWNFLSHDKNEPF